MNIWCKRYTSHLLAIFSWIFSSFSISSPPCMKVPSSVWSCIKYKCQLTLLYGSLPDTAKRGFSIEFKTQIKSRHSSLLKVLDPWFKLLCHSFPNDRLSFYCYYAFFPQLVTKEPHSLVTWMGLQAFFACFYLPSFFLVSQKGPLLLDPSLTFFLIF